MLKRTHAKLLSRSRHYALWHTDPHHEFVHFIVLGILLMGLAGYLIPFSQQQIAAVLQATQKNCRAQLMAKYGIKNENAFVKKIEHTFERVWHSSENAAEMEEEGEEDDPLARLVERELTLVNESCQIPGQAVAQAAKQRSNAVRGDLKKRTSSSSASLSTQDTSSVTGMSATTVDAASFTWDWLGPNNIGGRIRAISVNPSNSSDILVGSVAGGIWRTTNGGGIWSPVNDLMASVAISCLIRDPSNANTVYACTGEGYLNADSVRGLGLFKSTDGGSTWNQISSTNPTATNPAWYYVNRLAVSPTDPRVLLAATNNGLYRSADGGSTWSLVYQQVPRIGTVAFHPTNGAIAVLGEGNAGGGVAYSSDGGATWTRTRLTNSSVVSPNGRVEVAFSRSNPNIVYAVLTLANGQLYKSTDSGRTWTPDAPVSTPAHLGNQGWYNNALWVDPTNPQRVVVGGLGMKLSTDGGVTWTAIANNVHVDHHILESDPNYASNFTVYDGNDGGLYRGTNFNTFPTFSYVTGLGITQFYGGAGKAGGRIVGGTQDNGTLLWTGTLGWTRIWGSDGGESVADQVDGNYVYGMTQFGGVVRYTQALAATPPASASQYICTGIADASCNFNNPSPKINFTPPLAIDTTTNTTLYLGAQRLWRTKNSKEPTNTLVSWSAIKGAVSSGSYISAVAVARGNPNVVWVGYNNGEIACTTNALDPNPTWLGSGVSLSRWVTSITVDPNNPNRVFVTYGGYNTSNNLRVTTGGCVSSPVWTNLHASGSNLPSAPIRSVAINPINPAILYAGTEVGMFTSNDNGATWFTTDTGPGNVSIEELFWLDNSTLIAATHGRGMFRGVVTTAPPVTDTTPPLISISSPTNASTVSGTVTVSANASDTVGVTKVEFYKGTTLLGTDTSSPYSVNWNTTNEANGSYGLSAKAYDAANNIGTSASVTVTVSNTVVVPAPSASLSASPTSITAGGSSTLTWSSANATSCTGTNFTASGTSGSVSVAPTVTTAYSLTCTGVGGSVTKSVTVTVSAVVADTTAPSISISPNGGVASGSVTLTVTASDNSGTVSTIELLKDGVAVSGSRSGNTLTYTWNTTTETSGSHSFAANAYDPSNNKGSTNAVFSVDNTPVASDTTPPTISITKPVDGSIFPKGSLKITTTASDDRMVSKIEVYFDGTRIATCLNVTSCPATVSAKSVSAGTHTVSATAYDGASPANTASDTNTVTK